MGNLKTKLLLIYLFLISNFVFTQSSKNIYVELGGSAYKIDGALTINYFLGSNWKKDTLRKWSNELYLFVGNRNNFRNSSVTMNHSFISYGKGYGIQWKGLFFKPSMNGGVYHFTRRSFKGNEFDLGIQVNPRIQLGLNIKNFRISVLTNYYYGIGWLNYVNNNGENQNPNSKFPINNSGSLRTDISLSWRLN